MVKKWIPLEANPEVLNEYTKKLGLDTSKMSFCDVYSLDEVRACLSYQSHAKKPRNVRYTTLQAEFEIQN